MSDLRLAAAALNEEKADREKYKRQKERAEKKAARLSRRVDQDFRAPPSVLRKRKNAGDGCCRENCVRAYSAPLRARMRGHVGGMDPAMSRSFVAARLGELPSVGGRERLHRNRAYYLDTPESIEGQMIPEHPRQRRRVCALAFHHVLGVSNNKTAQPTVPGKAFRQDVNGGQRARTDARDDKAAGVRAFLEGLAESYQQEPDQDSVTVPFHNKEAVFGIYEDEVDDPCVSSYFMRVWRCSRELVRIKLRRWLRFALCDECIGLRERHDEARTAEEKRQIKEGSPDPCVLRSVLVVVMSPSVTFCVMLFCSVFVLICLITLTRHTPR